jgi:hypothetical protein
MSKTLRMCILRKKKAKDKMCNSMTMGHIRLIKGHGLNAYKHHNKCAVFKKKTVTKWTLRYNKQHKIDKKLIIFQLESIE